MKKYLLFLLFACLVISSCKKNNQKPQTPTVIISDPEARNQEGTKLLGTSIRYSINNSIQWTTYTYIGNSNYLNMLTDSTLFDDSPYPSTIGFLFGYDNAQNLISINSPGFLTTHFTTSSGVIANGFDSISSTNYYYNPELQMTNDSLFLNYYNRVMVFRNFMYDQSGNNSQIEIWVLDSTTNKFQKQQSITYQYDDKLNPYYGINYINYTQEAPSAVSVHNITSFQETDSSGIYNINIKYLYNSFNYPKYSIESSTGDTTKYYYY